MVLTNHPRHAALSVWVFSVPEDSTSSFLVALCLECSRPEDSASRFVVLTNHPRHAALSVLGVLGPGGLHKQLSGCSLS